MTQDYNSNGNGSPKTKPKSINLRNRNKLRDILVETVMIGLEDGIDEYFKWLDQYKGE